MTYIPGTNNGTSGFGMYRSLYPKNMGGPFGYKGFPLPNAFSHPISDVYKPYRMFGSQTRMLTPGGTTTSPSIGFNSFSKKKVKRVSKRTKKRVSKRTKKRVSKRTKKRVSKIM